MDLQGEAYRMGNYIQNSIAAGAAQGKASRLGRLVSQGLEAPGQRQSTLADIAKTVGAAEAQTASQMYQGEDDARNERLATSARVLLGAPDAQKATVYEQMRPGLAQILGSDPGPYSPEVMQFANQIAGAFGGDSGISPSVRSSFVGEDGQMYSIMSDGSVKAQGIGADRRLQAFDVEGVGPQVVDLRNATARTVTGGGGQPPVSQPASTFAFTPAPGMQDDPDADAFANLSPDQQEVAARLLQAKQDFTIQGGKVVPTGLSGGQPAARPASTAPAWVRPPKADQPPAPPSGYRYNAGGTLEPIPGGPADKPEATETAAESKARRDAALKLPRVDAAVRRLDRVSSAVESLASGLVDGGPIDAVALKYTPKGQELASAVASLLPELTALTRVPGIGSQSDLETRLASLQLPSLEFSPEINRRTLAELKTFMQDLADAYKTMAGDSGEAAPQDDDDALIGKYL